MPKHSRKDNESNRDRLFETRSEVWAAAGLEQEISHAHAKSAARRLAFFVPALIAVIVLEQLALEHIKDHHRHFIGGKLPVTVIAVIFVIWLGWLISRDLARLAPLIFKRMDPATAGTVEFVIRLLCVAATVLGALAVAGITLQAIAVGGAFTAVVVGLAAQQTLGNLFAGMVLLSARPFKLGELVHLQAGPLGGQVEGVVSSLGLLYTTLASGEDRIMIPNTVVLGSVVVPMREPDPVDVRARLSHGVRPSQLQQVLDENIKTATRRGVGVMLEEIDGDVAVVRVRATPKDPDAGVTLSDELIAALAGLTGEHQSSGRFET